MLDARNEVCLKSWTGGSIPLSLPKTRGSPTSLLCFPLLVPSVRAVVRRRIRSHLFGLTVLTRSQGRCLSPDTGPAHPVLRQIFDPEATSWSLVPQGHRAASTTRVV